MFEKASSPNQQGDVYHEDKRINNQEQIRASEIYPTARECIRCILCNEIFPGQLLPFQGII